jgi:serine O-acetyltransferase
MIFKRIQEYIDSFMARDPAARSRFEVVLCYPGLHAVAIYHVSHALWRRRFFVLARLISQIGRFVTGIEIHPGATIGKRLFIDHGIGVVIGETSEIGDDVTLYQGVTLGGIAPSVDSHTQVNVKRHPTLRNGVIVGSGAQILGGIIVGEGARVGANAVVSKDLPPGVTAVGIPAHPVMPRDRLAAARFVAYGTPAEGCPDPVLGTIESLRGQLAGLQATVGELEARLRHFEGGEVRDADGERVPPAKETTVTAMGEHLRR